MESLANQCYVIFRQSIDDYHLSDNVDADLQNPYGDDSMEALLYLKNWVDAVQWHLEDLVRDPDIDSSRGMAIKRRIDRLNQQRTDLVERLDDHFCGRFSADVLNVDARRNTESIGWAIDRLSILALKEFHMEVEMKRTDVEGAHLKLCAGRKEILLLQRVYLIESIDQLMTDMKAGKVIVKVYKQMKMYNDRDLNPVLYGKVTPLAARS
ncbi:MAG TPA: DUF4254 domain-containing protein [Puia sp.]|nr:DUF4254 domain-containing protein [Puia sp.]